MPSFADGLQVQRVLAAVEESAEKNSVYTPIASPDGRPAPCRAPSRSSPASGPTCRSKRSAGSPATSATTGSNSPAGATTSRSTRRSRTPPTSTPGSALLDKYGLKCWAISNHLVGQAVCDAIIDERHQAILPARIWGDGEAEGVRQRAAAEIADTARAAAAFGVDTVIGFTGSAIWHLVAMFPPAPESMIERGYEDFADALEPDPRRLRRRRACGSRTRSTPARSRTTTGQLTRALEAVDHRPAFGLNFDPSHFVWQDLDPVGFLWDFRDRIYHVDCKEARKRLDGRNGRLGSHLPWGDPRRGWDFVSAGHGDVPWEDVFRMLRSIDYKGPISVEWEDAGMDRLQGAPEALTRLKAYDFEPPSASFDAAFGGND